MLEAIAKQPELSRLTTRESVSEVLIQDIPFQLNSERPDVAAIRLERFCARVVIERCTVENRAAPCCALVIHDGAEITIADNRLLSFLVGALVFGFCDRLKSVGNRVSGLGATTADPAPVGLCGICIGVEPAGSNLICRIENNLIEEFLIGVHLGRGADGSVVAENRILRSERSDFSEVPDTAEKLRAYAKERFYAAFLAAQAGSKVTMPFVLDAARTEFRKLERPINEADFRVLEAVGRKA